MGRSGRFLLVLLTGLALLATGVHVVLNKVTRNWFESDLELRSRLAVSSARQSLEGHWSIGSVALRDTLTNITLDERIMAAAACSTSGELLVASTGYPAGFGCRAVQERMRRERRPESATWSMTTELPSGEVHIAVVGLEQGESELGNIILVHDLSYLSRRERTTGGILLVAFIVLALGASAVTLAAARLAWKRWTDDLRSALAGNAKREFQPLMRDVRSLMSQLTSEREARGTRWGPERLRAVLRQHVGGEQIVILANREPYIHEWSESGVNVVHPASGLVTALEPVMRACSGVWVAHGSGSADRETVDANDRVMVPPTEESYLIRRVWLSSREENGYYYGFSNEGLWPLCHVAHTRPNFRAEDYEEYKRVNRKFADAVCEEVDSDDPIVLVQDYHFALAPKMIRERLPKATIISFWHIPWPNAERVGICPWRDELLAGLLGSSVVGFHTQQHCNNFIDSVDAFMESRIDREANAVVQNGRATLVRPYPISIEWPTRWAHADGLIRPSREEVCARLGLSNSTLLGIGVDRLDYTKGIEERLMAVEQLLERYPEYRGKFTFVQVAAPSRVKIPHYRELSERVEALAADINAKWSTEHHRPIVLLRTHCEPEEVYEFYRAADVCYISSLHDGMNLVAKEFVAARDDERGVLVLSRFTGAARELTEALIVNPYDLHEASDALAVALRMPQDEQQDRMRSMRRIVAEFNVYRWAGRMLVDAAELRRKERLSGRWGAPTAVVARGAAE